MSKASKIQKTNAMRELEVADVKFVVHTYEVDENDLSGIHVAAQLGEDPNRVFKTIVTVSPSGNHVVCCIPVNESINLKAAAAVMGEKKLEMVHVKDLVGLTGYMRGGCSPVGMKKKFDTVFDETCQLFDTIMVSGGRRGTQIECDPSDLVAFCNAKMADIVAKEQ